MSSIVAKLIRLANELDQKGLGREADIVDTLIAEAVGEPRAYDIFANGRVAVKASVYNSIGDAEPPPNSQVKAEATLMVRPVENGQVQESKVLWSKQYVAHNVPELRNKMAADVATLKTQYSPATFDEQFSYYPVK